MSISIGHKAYGTRRRRVRLAFGVALWVTLLAGGCDSGGTSITPASQGTAAADKTLPPGTLPRPDHIVIVVEENKAYGQIIGNDDAPYLNQLANEGASLTRMYGIRHPSQPNYLALFSGSTQGVTDDSCPHRFSGANLASNLVQAGYTFAIYSQGLPRIGFDGCRHGLYVRKHNPAVNWQGHNVGAGQNQPFRNFPRDFDALPTVAWVIPDLDHDMHSASIAAGDRWLKHNLGAYARWARRHNSVLIVTSEEDDRSANNHIVTLLVGEMVEPGRYDTQYNLYNMLRTIEAMYGLPLVGASARAAPITKAWRDSG